MSGLRSKWVIIKQIVEGKIEYQVSDHVLGLRSTYKAFDDLENAQKYLKEIRKDEFKKGENNE